MTDDDDEARGRREKLLSTIKTLQPCQFSTESQAIPLRSIKNCPHIKNAMGSKDTPYKLLLLYHSPVHELRRLVGG